MPNSIVEYINQYGYLILFLMVFIQEVGVPTFPNEIFLYYFGYLCGEGLFSISVSLPVAISADIAGTSFLYFLFFLGGKTISRIRRKIIKPKKDNTSKNKLYEVLFNTKARIIIARCTPFIRGYLTVYAALTKFDYKNYFVLIIFSAIIYDSFFMLFGFFTGKYFIKELNKISQSFSSIQIIFSIAIVIAVIIYSKHIIIKLFTNKKNTIS